MARRSGDVDIHIFGNSNKNIHGTSQDPRKEGSTALVWFGTKGALDFRPNFSNHQSQTGNILHESDYPPTCSPHRAEAVKRGLPGSPKADIYLILTLKQRTMLHRPDRVNGILRLVNWTMMTIAALSALLWKVELVVAQMRTDCCCR
jgi:hypothetical protein